MSKNEYMSIKEASQYLNVNLSTIYRWAKAGRLTLYKKGVKSTVIKITDIERIKTENETIKPIN